MNLTPYLFEDEALGVEEMYDSYCVDCGIVDAVAAVVVVVEVDAAFVL